MAVHTLLDIAKLNGNDATVGLIEENLAAAPEFGVLPARTIRGISYKTVIRTDYPGVGFRYANEATTPTVSAFINKMVECFILSAIVQVDKAVANAYEDGPGAWQAIEASGVMRQALIELGQQVIYGTVTTGGAVGNAKGFPGLLQAVDSTVVVDAGGTTADTGSSIYAIRRGPRDVQVVLGNGSPLELGAFREQVMSNIDSYVAALTGWAGLQIVNKYAVGRIKKITADAGKTASDSLIADLLQKFPVGNRPDLLIMNRRSYTQLLKSRTVTINANGDAAAGGSVMAMPPAITSSFNIPIVVTDSIVDTESLTVI